MPFIGFILVLMAAFAVGGTLYMVVREKHEAPEEWYIPPATSENKSVPPVEPPPTTSAINTPIPVPPATANPDVAPADQPADKPADKTE